MQRSYGRKQEREVISKGVLSSSVTRGVLSECETLSFDGEETIEEQVESASTNSRACHCPLR